MKPCTRYATIALGAIFALTLAGCADLFTTNYFENFDGPPDASDISYDSSDPDGYLDDLGEAMESDRFIDDLSDSERDELTENLEDIYTDDTAEPDQVQEAALLAAELQMNGTGAGETANNVVELFMNADDESGDAFEDPDALLEGLIPEDAQGDEEEIAAILTDLVSAGLAYNAYGESITTDEPDDGVSGDTAQNAAVAILVMTIAGVDDDDTPEEQAAAVEALAASVAGGTVADDYASADMGTALDDGTPLATILEQAGFDTSMFGGDEE